MKVGRRDGIVVGLVLAAAVRIAVAAGEVRIAPPADGSDAVPLLRDALARCRAERAGRLVLAKGVWNLHPERAEGMHRHISNHDPGTKRVAIHLDGVAGFEIDGGGATLMCHGVMMPFAVDRSTRVAIRNLTIDWDKPFHLEGTVLQVGEDFFDVAFLPECEVVLRDGRIYGGMAELFFGELQDPGQARQDFQWNYWIDPATKAAAAIQPRLSLWNARHKAFAEITQPETNRFRFRNAHNALPAAGSVMVCKGMNRPNRLSPAIHLSSVDGVTVENVTIHHAGGMGVIAEDCTDPVLRNVRVALRPGSKSLITTTADATHFVGCRGKVTVEGCLFENMLDDSCNVHGVYAIAEGLLAPDRLAVSFSHFEQLGTAFARPGDRMRLLQRDTLLPYADCALKAIERHNEDYYVLTLDRPMADLYRTNSSVENVTTRPDFDYVNNTVRNNRARGILVTSGGKVRIENNRFERPSMMGVLVEGDNNFWYEAGGVEDLTIRGNRFVGLSATAPVFRLAPLQPKETRLLPPYHRNIRILDNTIEAAGPLVVDANRIAGLEFAGNTVVFAAGAAEGPAAKLRACEDVSFRNNRFSRPATIACDPADAAVRLEANENLTRK
jgi:hypothetical protein